MNHRLAPAHSIPNPTEYIIALLGECSEWSYDQPQAKQFKSNWRSEVFKREDDFPMDVEIGTGNGYHFADYAKINPGRGLVGLEVKFKPLIQSIRRALRDGSTNARVVRHDAGQLGLIFGHHEIDNLIIHHPDPWPKKRHWKNRLIQIPFLQQCFELQRPGSFLEFKTDSLDYFQWSMEKFESSDYELEYISYDFHKTDKDSGKFVTHFEKLFVRQGIAINYAKFLRR